MLDKALTGRVLDNLKAACSREKKKKSLTLEDQPAHAALHKTLFQRLKHHCNTTGVQALEIQLKIRLSAHDILYQPEEDTEI